jgi:4-oxalocrotonate tautomerase
MTCCDGPTKTACAERRESSRGRRSQGETGSGGSFRSFPRDDAPSHEPQTNYQRKDNTMPLIQVKLIEGVFDAAEKAAIIEKLTDAMVGIEGEAMRPVTWVTVEEVPSGAWGIAGKPLHTGDVLGMRRA